MIPVDASAEDLPETMWRIDRLKELTYTQFWHLIQERSIERVCSLATCCDLFPIAYSLSTRLSSLQHQDEGALVLQIDSDDIRHACSWRH